MDVVMIITTDHFILAATWKFSLFSVFVFVGSKKRKERKKKKRKEVL
jgi:hypothetical protein